MLGVGDGLRGLVAGGAGEEAEFTSSGRDGGRAEGGLTRLVEGVGEAADVPQLGEDEAARLVDGGGDEAPAGDLGRGEEAGGMRPFSALRGDESALGDDEADVRGTEGVVVGVELGRDEAAVAGERAGDDAVAEGPGTDADGLGEDVEVRERGSHVGEQSEELGRERCWREAR